MKQFTKNDDVDNKKSKLATLILRYEQMATNTEDLRACNSLDELRETCCGLLMNQYQTTEDEKSQQELMMLYVEICLCQFDIAIAEQIARIPQQTAERLRVLSAELVEQQHAGLNTLLTKVEQLKALVSDPAVKPAIDTLYSRLAEFSNLCEVAAPVSELSLLSRVLFFVSDPARRQLAGVAKAWRAAASVAWEERLQRDLPAVFAARNGRTDYPRMLVEHARAQLVAQSPDPIVDWEAYTSNGIASIVGNGDFDRMYQLVFHDRYPSRVQYCILAGYPVSSIIRTVDNEHDAPLLYWLLGLLLALTEDNQNRHAVLQIIELLLDFGADTHFRTSFNHTIAHPISRLPRAEREQMITLLKQYRHEFTAEECLALFQHRTMSNEEFLATVDSLPVSAANRRLCVIHHLEYELSIRVVPPQLDALISRLQLSEPGLLAQIIAARATRLFELLDFTAEELSQRLEGSSSLIETAFAQETPVPLNNKRLYTALLHARGTFTLEPQAARAILRKLGSVCNRQELNLLLLSILYKGFTAEDCLAVDAENSVFEYQGTLIDQCCPSDADVQTALQSAIHDGKTKLVRVLSRGCANIFSVDGTAMSAAEYALIHGQVEIAEQLAKRSLAIIFFGTYLVELRPVELASVRSQFPKHLQLLFALCGFSEVPGCKYLDKPARYASIPGIEAHILKLLPADYQITATLPGTINLIQGACVFRNAKLLEFLLAQFNVDLHEMPLTIVAAFDNVRDHADLQALKDTVAVLESHGFRFSEAEQEILKAKIPRLSAKLEIINGLKEMIDELCERSCECVLTTDRPTCKP